MTGVDCDFVRRHGDWAVFEPIDRSLLGKHIRVWAPVFIGDIPKEIHVQVLAVDVRDLEDDA